MIKPKALKKGQKIAVVSLSWGGLGDKDLIHKYDIARERLENEFGLNVVAMPHALKGSEFIYRHPELRAKDLMDAFRDESINGIICAIGGDDSVRILPYIDYEVIKNNPKIFMGYSDTTVSHFMMQKAGLVSYYGPAIMSEFGEYVKMFDYTKEAVEHILFRDTTDYEIKSARFWSNDFVEWKEENINYLKQLQKEKHGYEVLNGSGKISGKLIGGCIDVFPMIAGTEIWPDLSQWNDKILLLETSEDKPSPQQILYIMRNLGAQGILQAIRGILVGKPQDEMYYEEYKEIFRKIIKEFDCCHLGVLYNVNIGHAAPTGVLPLGIDYEIDLDGKTIRLKESGVQIS